MIAIILNKTLIQFSAKENKWLENNNFVLEDRQTFLNEEELKNYLFETYRLTLSEFYKQDNKIITSKVENKFGNFKGYYLFGYDIDVFFIDDTKQRDFNKKFEDYTK